MPGFREGNLIIDRYQVLSFLGGGLFSEVYKVKDLVSDKVLALKILKSEYKNQKEVSSRISQEFALLSHFNHPNIIAGFGF
jgi:serine/threonine protein kinase